MDPIETFAQYLVEGYAIIVAFFIGWIIPRGNALRKIQLYFFTKLHDFFAFEEERLQKRVDATKAKIRKN